MGKSDCPHLPPPWNIVRSEGYICIVGRERGQPVLIAEVKSLDNVAVTNCHARLICLAPQFLDCLKYVVTKQQVVEGRDVAEIGSIGFNLIRSIIQEAEGGS